MLSSKLSRLSSRLPHVAALSLSLAAASLSLLPPAPSRSDSPTNDTQGYDIYLTNPTPSDLPLLLKSFQEGQEVWPWIWTQPNDDGPHHVFVGVTAKTLLEIASLRQKLTLKDGGNPNILLIASPSQVASVPSSLLSHCGVVTTAKLSLINAEAKLIMLDDERVISFDYLTVS